MDKVSGANLQSPPKPHRRMMSFNVGTTAQAPQSEVRDIHKDNDDLSQFEGGLVDRAVSDLPHIASQVFSLNKNQSSAIQRQQKLLAFLQEKVNEGDDKVTEIGKEITCVMNRIFVAEETDKETSKRIKTMNADIKQLIRRVLDKETENSRAREAADFQLRKLQKHQEKVDRYSENVEQFEQSTSNVYSELQKTKHEVEELRNHMAVVDTDMEEKERLVAGIVEQELLSEIDTIKSQLLKEGSDAKLNISKLTEERLKHKHQEQTIQVLYKRNNAQMTRLRRQVKELQTRNRHKQNQLVQLQTNMALVEKQLDQYD